MRPGQGKKNKRVKKHKGRPKHVPQRTCVGCRAVHPKREIVRVVRTPEGTVEIDEGGKQSGRGAYLCRKRACWESAFKRRSIERALKVTLDDATKEVLATYATTLPGDVSEEPEA